MSSLPIDSVSTTPPLLRSQSIMDSSDEDKLLAALESGDFQTALQLLPKDSPSPPTVGPDNLTPLHYACQHGREDIALLLITEYNYSINSRSRIGQTPLHFAAKYGHLELMKLLVQQSHVIQHSESTGEGSSNAKLVSQSSLTDEQPTSKEQLLQHETPFLSAADNDGNTPLHLAAIHGHLLLTKYLIHDAHCNPAPTNSEKQTPQHLAAMHGHLDLLQYLVEEEGCDPSARDEQGRTPLYLAAGSGHLEVVKYLTTEKQCDPNCRTTKCKRGTERSQEIIQHKFATGRTPLHAASEGGHLGVAQYLIDELNCNHSCTDDDGRTPLYVASCNGRITMVKFLTEKKHCDSFYTTNVGNTPLHAAALGGNLEVVKFFISEKGCDPMCRGQWGRTPLHYASQNGHLEIVKYLIDEQHVDPSCLDEEFKLTPLRLASKGGHLAVVKFLTVEKHCDPLHKDKFGNTPLHEAALGGSLEVVKFFISEKGCDPMCRGQLGRTPLHCASQNDHLEIVKYLIDEQHVDPSCLDEEFKLTPLKLASNEGHLAIVKFLTEEKHCDPLHKDKLGNTPLHGAALGGSLEVVKFFISEKGCDPMCRGQLGRTPLHCASQEGHIEIVKYLVDEQHVDPSCLDEEFKLTPLKLASNEGHLAVVTFLTEKKHCDPLHKDKLGTTPLHGAALGGSLEVVKFFISEKGCDPMCRGRWGRTPLHCASQEGHIEIVKYLIDEQHVNPSCLDEEFKLTPLRLASNKGHLAVVKFLTEEKHCDPLYKDKLGNTPLHGAALGGSLEVVRFFISEKGCDPMCRGRWGRTPLHCASQEGHIEIVKYLIDEQHVDPSCLDAEFKLTSLRLASNKGHLEVVQFLTEEKHCDLLHKDKLGNTPLHGAALGGSLEVVKFFISEKGCDPMCRGQLGRTPLHCASQEGHIEMVKYLIDEQHVDSSCLDEEFKLTPLRLASIQGHLAVVMFLTEEKHCDPLHKNKLGNTSLHGAALGGSLEVVKFFISEKGCDPMCRGQWGRTPLHDASQNGHLEIVKYLIDEQHVDPSCIDEEFKLTPLKLASNKGHLALVKFLTEKKHCDPLHKDKLGNTPLHGAALGGSLEVVKFFISEKGCDPMCRGQLGRTPLHCASQEGHIEIVKYLIDEQHVDPSCLDEEFKLTPLRLASIQGHLAVVMFLTEEKHSDPLHKNKLGNTPLHGAALGGSLEIVKFFINEKGCEPMCRGQWGRTPLHDASQEGHLEIVKYLIDEQQGDASCPDDNDVTPLHMASRNGHLDVVRYLVERKLCDPTVKARNGETPVDLAIANKKTVVVRYLISKGVTLSRYLFTKGVAISPLLKIHVVGNSGSGKSSLVKALQEEDSPIAGRFLNISGVFLQTSGIIPVEFDSNTLDEVTLYDLPGYEECYVRCESVYESNSHPIVLLTVNLSDPSDEIRNTIDYWESLVGNALSTSAHVIAIGSHSDTLSAHDLQVKSAILFDAMESHSNMKGVRHAGWVTLDCRKSSSAGISTIRQLLHHICKSEGDFDYKNALNIFLKEQLLNVKACTSTELLIWILESRDPKLQQLKSPHFLFQTCESLNKSGHILFLKNEERPEESWLILNKEAIISDVHSLLKQVKLSIISQSQLRAIIENSGLGLRTDLVRLYLVQMEFCIEIESHLLELIGGSELPHIKENCFLFPDLLSGNRPVDVWQQNPYSTGWGLKCKMSFTPRFLQVILVHLASRFALNLHPKSSDLLEPAQGYRLWKNGIRWLDQSEVEVIVEITDSSVLNLILRCLQQDNEQKKGNEMRLIQLRTSIIQQVLNAKALICPDIKPEEYLLHPKCLQTYPMKEIYGIPLDVIAKAIMEKDHYLNVEGSGSPEFLSIKELLYFEPYQNLNVELLQQLFDEQATDNKIPHDALCEIATALQNKWDILSELPHVTKSLISEVELDRQKDEAQKCLDILNFWSARDGTYGSLRQVLDQYSIFAGRNPLDLCPVEAVQKELERRTKGSNSEYTATAAVSVSGQLQASSETTVVSKEIQAQPGLPEKRDQGVQTGTEPTFLQTAEAIHLRGVQVIGETTFIVTKDAPVTLNWKEYGFILHIPEDALPTDVEHCHIHVKATTQGQFRLPDSHELVSAVFWIWCHHKLSKPAMMEIEHCAALTTHDKCSALTFVRSHCTQETLPYTFKPIPDGVFSPNNCYGSISLSRFSAFGIAFIKHLWRKEEDTNRYCAQLYCAHKGGNHWNLYFVLIRELSADMEAIKAYFSGKATLEIECIKITLEEDHITLDIPPEGFVHEGWKVLPCYMPTITKEDTHRFVSGSPMPALCELQAEWQHDQSRPRRLNHLTKIIGACPPRNYFQLTVNPVLESGQPPAPDGQSTTIDSLPVFDQRPTMRELHLFMYEKEGREMSLEIIEPVSHKWKKLGNLLGIHDSVLEGYGGSVPQEESCRQVFRKWCDSGSEQYPLKWKGVIRLLNNAGLLILAEDLRTALPWKK